MQKVSPCSEVRHHDIPHIYFISSIPIIFLLIKRKYHNHFVSSRYPLLWRHNGRDGVSNHQPQHYLLNRLFRRRSKKTSKNPPHKWPVTRKMFPFDDVIMTQHPDWAWFISPYGRIDQHDMFLPNTLGHMKQIVNNTILFINYKIIVHRIVLIRMAVLYLASQKF